MVAGGGGGAAAAGAGRFGSNFGANSPWWKTPQPLVRLPVLTDGTGFCYVNVVISKFMAHVKLGGYKNNDNLI